MLGKWLKGQIQKRVAQWHMQMHPVLPHTALSDTNRLVKKCFLLWLLSQEHPKRACKKILQIQNCPGNGTISKKVPVNKTLRIRKEGGEKREKRQEGCHPVPASTPSFAEPIGVLEKQLLKWSPLLPLLILSLYTLTCCAFPQQNMDFVSIRLGMKRLRDLSLQEFRFASHLNTFKKCHWMHFSQKKYALELIK